MLSHWQYVGADVGAVGRCGYKGERNIFVEIIETSSTHQMKNSYHKILTRVVGLAVGLRKIDGCEFVEGVLAVDAKEWRIPR